MMKILTREMLRGFKYAPKTGLLYRFDKPKGSRWNGIIRHKNNCGYLEFSKDGTRYSAHRAAFVLMGMDPIGKYVDHINGDRSDNRWDNLRLVDARKNQHNRKEHRSGNRMIGANLRNGRYQCVISFEGKTYNIGNFKNKEDANKAYFEALSLYEKTGKILNRHLKRRDLPKNIYRNKNGKPYTARYEVDGKKLYLGRFDTVQDAENAINRFRKEHLGLGPQPCTGRHQPDSLYFLRESLERERP